MPDTPLKPDDDGWWMIEREDLEKRPMYFCWDLRPNPDAPAHSSWRRGRHAWTPNWEKGERFSTKEAAEEHTNNDPLLHVRSHAMVQVDTRTPSSAPEVSELIARLLAVNSSGEDYGVTCSYRNPDGPEAVSALETLEARVRVLEEALKRLSSSFTGGWAGMYRDRAEVIGEVEQIARAALLEQLSGEKNENSH